MTNTFDFEVSLHYWLLWPTVRRGGGRETLNHSKSQLALVYSYKLCALVQCKPRPFMFLLSLQCTIGLPCLFAWNGVRPEASNILCFEILSSAPVHAMIKVGVEWCDGIFYLLTLLSTNEITTLLLKGLFTVFWLVRIFISLAYIGATENQKKLKWSQLQ